MILPDVNMLLYAHDSRGLHYPKASAWWQECLDGPEPVGLAWVVLLGFIRISTNARIYDRPQSPATACATISEWLTLPHFHLVHPARRHFDRLRVQIEQLGTAGNLTTDAHLATLASEHGYILHTTDADISRFTGVKWINPLLSSS